MVEVFITHAVIFNFKKNRSKLSSGISLNRLCSRFPNVYNVNAITEKFKISN